MHTKIHSYLITYVCLGCNMTFKSELDQKHMYRIYILHLYKLLHCLKTNINVGNSSKTFQAVNARCIFSDFRILRNTRSGIKWQAYNYSWTMDYEYLILIWSTFLGSCSCVCSCVHVCGLSHLAPLPSREAPHCRNTSKNFVLGNPFVLGR